LTRFWRGSFVIVTVEAAVVSAIYLSPGAGHSPLFYTQMPALILVGRLAPDAGTCLSCAPRAWLAGIVSQTILMIALWALIARVLHVRNHAHT
jgi:hypothetical protein